MHMPCTCRMHMPHAHAKVPPSFYFIFTLKAEMITGCLKAHGKPTGSGPAADPAADPAAAVRSEPWQLIKLGPGAAGEMAPAGARQWGSRQLLEWAKSREAQEAGLGLDQQALELFVRRVVTLFTEAYAHTTLKHGRLVEGGRVSMPLPQSCALLRAVDARFPRSLDIFDFSERHALRRAAEVNTRTQDVGNILVCRDVCCAGEVASGCIAAGGRRGAWQAARRLATAGAARGGCAAGAVLVRELGFS